MTRAQDILARVLTIAVMVAVIASLMRLTAAPASTPIQSGAHAAAAEPATRAERITAMAAAWSGDIAFGAPYAALSPLSAEESAAADSLFDPTDEYWGLPRSEGVDLVAGYCSACHSLAIVMQQRQNEEGWNYLLDWMIKKQGMAAPPSDMRADIIAYLTREFGAE